jgi:hypothetical protein
LEGITEFDQIASRRQLGRDLQSNLTALRGTAQRRKYYNDILFGELVQGQGGFMDRIGYFMANTVNPAGDEMMFYDRNSEAGQFITKFFKDNYGIDLSNYNEQQFTAALSGQGEVGRAITDIVETIRLGGENFDANLDMLRRSTEMTTEELEAVAASLGIDFTKGLLDATHATAVFAAQMLPLIDRNRAFFPSFSTSPLGQAEARATANAAFTTLVNADTMTVDLVRDAFETFAAYEIAMGMSPDIAGFSSNFELIEKVFPNLSPEKQQALMGMLATGSFEMATSISDAYQIPIEQILAFAGDDNIIGSDIGELIGIENFLNERSTIRSALNLGSGLSGSERLGALLDLEQITDSDFSMNLRKRLFDILGIEFGSLDSTSNLLDLVDTQTDEDSSKIVLQELVASGFISAQEANATQSLTALEEIQGDMARLAGAVDASGTTVNVHVTGIGDEER